MSSHPPEQPSQPSEQPYSDSHLESPEYRKRLLKKLNTLIAVLEVACAKVRRSLTEPEADIERLTRIQNNLRETLQVCQRAKHALERCEQVDEAAASAPESRDLIPRPGQPEAQRVPGNARKLRSAGEQRRFEKLGPLDLRQVRACDLDDLCRRLLG